MDDLKLAYTFTQFISPLATLWLTIIHSLYFHRERDHWIVVVLIIQSQRNVFDRVTDISDGFLLCAAALKALCLDVFYKWIIYNLFHFADGK